MVPEVEVLEQAVGLAEKVPAQLDLKAAGAVAQVQEGCAPHDGAGP